MQTLTVEAASKESATALHAALSRFQAELIESEDGSYHVAVPLGGGDRDIINVLSAIEDYVTSRRTDAARIQLNGRSYVMHGAPDPAGSDDLS